MTRTVTAFFDNYADAESAKRRLETADLDISRVHLHGASSSSGSTSTGSTTGTSAASTSTGGATGSTTSSGSTSGAHGGGFFSSLKEMFVSDEDAYAYDEGIRRGGCVLSAEVDDDNVEEVVRLLDEAETVDFDERESGWRSEGWGGYDRTATGNQPAMFGDTTSGASGAATGMTGTTGETGRVVDEERIPVIEEELRIGKREVERGGARVRTYVREIPVQEQVSLREEHVSVERRAVDEPLGHGAVDAEMLRDRTIEMTETAEEAVVGKEARIAEEVVVRKTAEERVEQVSDTVRRTEVEVDDTSGTRLDDDGLGRRS